MSHESQCLADEEFVLRRIHKNHIDPGPPAIVGFTAFRPTPEDTAGLSVYREEMVAPAIVAGGGRKKRCASSPARHRRPSRYEYHRAQDHSIRLETSRLLFQVVTDSDSH